MNKHPFNTKYLTAGYLLALSLIAGLSLLGHMAIRHVLKEQTADAKVINLSGRQRMLSQMLTKNSLLMARNDDPAVRERFRNLMASRLAEWEEVHEGLRHGSEKLGLPKNDSAEAEYYFGLLEPKYQKLKAGLETILKNDPSKPETLTLRSGPLREVIETSPVYVQIMDNLVFAFQKEADEKVDRLRLIETLIILSVMGLLSVEAIFIFRPMVNRVERFSREMREAEELLQMEAAQRNRFAAELIQAKTTLEDTVQDRVKELVETNERLAREIAGHKHAEDSLKASFKEKDLLLQELHHRVKNNMQIISSLLRLKSGKVKNPEDAALFIESEALIRSMSLVHEKLFKSNYISGIIMSEYLGDLVDGLVRAYAVPQEKIRFSVAAGNITLGAEKAVPCGIMVNELVTNVIKHAFPGDSKGEAAVSLTRGENGTVLMTVSDTGIGIRAERRNGSFGLDLVERLAREQLGGTLETGTGDRTEFRISFLED